MERQLRADGTDDADVDRRHLRRQLHRHRFECAVARDRRRRHDPQRHQHLQRQHQRPERAAPCEPQCTLAEYERRDRRQLDRQWPARTGKQQSRDRAGHGRGATAIHRHRWFPFDRRQSHGHAERRRRADVGQRQFRADRQCVFPRHRWCVVAHLRQPDQPWRGAAHHRARHRHGCVACGDVRRALGRRWRAQCHLAGRQWRARTLGRQHLHRPDERRRVGQPHPQQCERVAGRAGCDGRHQQPRIAGRCRAAQAGRGRLPARHRHRRQPGAVDQRRRFRGTRRRPHGQPRRCRRHRDMEHRELRTDRQRIDPRFCARRFDGDLRQSDRARRRLAHHPGQRWYGGTRRHTLRCDLRERRPDARRRRRRTPVRHEFVHRHGLPRCAERCEFERQPGRVRFDDRQRRRQWQPRRGLDHRAERTQRQPDLHRRGRVDEPRMDDRWPQHRDDDDRQQRYRCIAAVRCNNEGCGRRFEPAPPQWVLHRRDQHHRRVDLGIQRHAQRHFQRHQQPLAPHRRQHLQRHDHAPEHGAGSRRPRQRRASLQHRRQQQPCDQSCLRERHRRRADDDPLHRHGRHHRPQLPVAERAGRDLRHRRQRHRCTDLERQPRRQRQLGEPPDAARHQYASQHVCGDVHRLQCGQCVGRGRDQARRGHVGPVGQQQCAGARLRGQHDDQRRLAAHRFGRCGHRWIRHRQQSRRNGLHAAQQPRRVRQYGGRCVGQRRRARAHRGKRRLHAQPDDGEHGVRQQFRHGRQRGRRHLRPGRALVRQRWLRRIRWHAHGEPRRCGCRCDVEYRWLRLDRATPDPRRCERGRYARVREWHCIGIGRARFRSARWQRRRRRRTGRRTHRHDGERRTQGRRGHARPRREQYLQRRHHHRRRATDGRHGWLDRHPGRRQRHPRHQCDACVQSQQRAVGGEHDHRRERHAVADRHGHDDARRCDQHRRHDAGSRAERSRSRTRWCPVRCNSAQAR